MGHYYMNIKAIRGNGKTLVVIMRLNEWKIWDVKWLKKRKGDHIQDKESEDQTKSNGSRLNGQ